MRRRMEKIKVLALGGSILCPEQIDARFIKRFRKFIYQFLRKKYKFVIVIGGGRIARLFQAAAHAVVPVTDEDKDWLGIHATRLNAHLLRTVFREAADPVVIDDRHRLRRLTHSVTIASGWQPGWSTDYVAAVLAHDFGVEEVIIAGKPDHVYDKDPSLHKTARPVEKLSWAEYRKMIPRKWKPGSHSPVDPVAAEFAAKHNLRAVVLDGRDLKNLARLLEGKRFNGTVIR